MMNRGLIGHKDSRVWIGACALAEKRHPRAKFPQPQDIKDSETVIYAIDGNLVGGRGPKELIE